MNDQFLLAWLSGTLCTALLLALALARWRGGGE